MGWQDREYAQGPGAPGRGHGPPGRRGFGGSRAWSIVTTLIVINVAVHLLRPMAPQATIPIATPVLDPTSPNGVAVVTQDVRTDAPFALGAMHAGQVVRGQVWRLVTSQYLHSREGLIHLLLNMLGLYFFGRPLERLWTRQKFLVIYTLAGLAGNLFLLLMGVIGWINPNVPAVGASGCILGLLGLCAVMFPHAEVLVYFLFPVKIRTAAIVLALGYAYNIWKQGGNFGGDACHLAGMAFGVWYAKRGELWWRARGAPVWARWRSKLVDDRQSSPRPRQGRWEQRVQGRQADAELIDRLLAKVYEGGLHSLTPTERKQLTEATERQRQAEAAAGRTDRL
ncbi:MAG: rhomboid family intramembrane serine protease [bacterium]|nr:rhomboid family intramembrane serine protease [bacterium]